MIQIHIPFTFQSGEGTNAQIWKNNILKVLPQVEQDVLMVPKESSLCSFIANY